jgi:threonine dehydratase
MLKLREVYEARKRVQRWARRTPVERSAPLGALCGGEVWLKLENYQVTGSFKIRGAANKLLSLNNEERQRGVITASSGNHAQGVGYAARELGVKATIVVPENTPSVKIDAIRGYDVDLIVEGREYMDSERLARRMERELGMTFVSAYNDLDIIRGQATVGLEMLEDAPGLDAVLVPVGGGGLASGVASVFKAATDMEVIGVQTTASPVMRECVREGRVHDVPLGDTYAEGLHGGIEEGSVTFELCRDLVDRWIVVEEETVLEAVGFMLHRHHMLVEGAAAVGPAAIMANPGLFKGRRVGVVISGGNLSAETLRKVA